MTRSVRQIMARPPAHWVGDGFHVYPVFSNLAFQEELSPLLMFDYAAPKEFKPNKGQPLGVGQHPHRGKFIGGVGTLHALFTDSFTHLVDRL